VKRYLEPLTKLIQEKKVDTTFLITHRSADLRDGPGLYKTFKEGRLREGRVSSWRVKAKVCFYIGKTSSFPVWMRAP
jgi:hypothetical protein